MNRAQSRRRFEQQRDQSASALGMVAETLAAQTAGYERLRADAATDPELLRKLAGTNLGAAELQHELTVKHLETLINLTALESRLGRQERAEARHAELLHHAHASQVVVDLWAGRFEELGGDRESEHSE